MATHIVYREHLLLFDLWIKTPRLSLLNRQEIARRKLIPFDRLPTRCNITQFIYFKKTVLHVSGGISTHHQEHTQLYLQHLAHVKPLLLPAAIVEELELVWVWCGNCTDLWRHGSVQFPHNIQTSSNSTTIEAGSNNGYQVPDAVNTVVCAPEDGWR